MSDASLTNRYRAPKPRLSARTRTIIIAVVLAVAVIGTGIFTFTSGTPSVGSKDISFNILDAEHATVDFEVTKDPGATVECAIQVLSQNYAVVGWKTERIGPNPADSGHNSGRTTSHRSEVRTESLGVSGGVNACWVLPEGS